LNIKRAQKYIGIPILTLLATLSLAPLLWLIVSAVTPQTFLLQIPPSLSLKTISFENFQKLFEISTIPRWFFNSLYLSLINTFNSVMIATYGGFIFAKINFKGKKLLFMIILSSLMIPFHVTLIPSFLILKSLKLTDTHLSLILPALVNVFGLFLMRQAISTFPQEILDQARIDGASEMDIFLKIIIPLAKSQMFVLAILTFVAQWNSFLWPLIVLNRSKLFTIQVGLATLQDQFLTDYGILMAGAFITSLPVILVFFLFSRYLTNGIFAGAIKS